MFAFATLKNGIHYVNSFGVAGSGGVLARIAALKEERAAPHPSRCCAAIHLPPQRALRVGGKGNASL